MASPTTTGQLTAFIPTYWDAVLGENLYPNLYFGLSKGLESS